MKGARFKVRRDRRNGRYRGRPEGWYVEDTYREARSKTYAFRIEAQDVANTENARIAFLREIEPGTK
jgi:hypothetical protein